MIPQPINHLIPERQGAALAGIPTPVMGFIYPDGRREYRPHHSLEHMYHELLLLDPPISYYPDYLMMADGSILIYVHQLFYQTFSLQAFTEPELREMIDLSNLLSN